jgi:lipopolysaccharide exporter
MAEISAKKIAKSGLWMTISFVLVRLLQLLTQVILARLLSPQEFGIWGIILIVTTLSNLFKEHSIAAVLVQRGLDNEQRVNAVYSIGISLSIMLGILQTLLSYPLAVFFDTPQVMPLLAAVSLGFMISAGTGIREAILQRQMKFGNIAQCEITMAIARLIGTIGCAMLGGGVWAFVMGELCMVTVGAIVARCLCPYPLKYSIIPDREALRDVQGYITSILSINLAVYFNTNADNFIVGKLLGTKELGLYSVAYQLAMLPTFALSQIHKVNASVLSQSEPTVQKKYLCQLLEFYSIICAPVYGILFLMSSWLIPTLYGLAWQPAIGVFQIILIAAYARGIMSILGTFLNAIDNPKVNALINWILVPIAIPAFYFGTLWGGITGVSVAALLIMGMIATAWFLIAVCWTTQWKINVLISPILIPTVSAVLSILIVMSLTTPIFWKVVLFSTIYGINLSLFSVGRIPHKIYRMAQKSYS